MGSAGDGARDHVGPSPAEPREPGQLAEGPGGGARLLRCAWPCRPGSNSCLGPGGALESGRAASPLGDRKHLPRTTAGHQSSVHGLSWQEYYWSGFAFPTPAITLTQELNPGSCVSWALVAGRLCHEHHVGSPNWKHSQLHSQAVNRCEQIQQSQRG